MFSEEDPASPKPVEGMCPLKPSPLEWVSKEKLLEILKLYIVKYWKTILSGEDTAKELSFYWLHHRVFFPQSQTTTTGVCQQ